MNNKSLLYITFFFFLASIQSQAQNEKQKNQIRSKYNSTQLTTLEQTFIQKSTNEKQLALQIAQQRGWKTRMTKPDGSVMELQRVMDGKPVYYTTYNHVAARSTRTNHLHNGGTLGLNLMGRGMTAHVWDDGRARASHREFDGAGGSNRFSVGDNSDRVTDHATHVTGTIIGHGADSDARGMAPHAKVVGYHWDNDLGKAATAAANGMLISNHSYGFLVRHPDTGEVLLHQYSFGGYITYSRGWDQLMFNAPYYLMVTSAGNNGNDNTANTNPTGGFGFDKLSGSKTAKNNLVVANAHDALVDANGNLISVTIYPSSSQGPTDDFRIKPDITGNGTNVYSSSNSLSLPWYYEFFLPSWVDEEQYRYQTKTGTSMASPNVTGSLLLLQEHFYNLNESFMRSATLKGLALHTADDAGPPGPDAIYGWGLLNAKRAAEAISNNGDEVKIEELTLYNGSSYTTVVEADGSNPLMASISWTDRPGSAVFRVNSTTPVLVNDLDVRVSRGNTIHRPYELTGATTSTTRDNNVDPFERIDVTDASGIYTITVTHKGTLVGGNQDYTLIVTGIDHGATEIANAAFKVDNIEYEVTGINPNTVTAIGYTGTGGDLAIPQIVTNGANNFNVTTIGNYAFANSQLTSVTLPDSLTSIEHGAFRDNELTEVVIPDSVTSIGNSAFEDNPNLSTVVSKPIDPPSIEENTFNRSQIDVIVPRGTAVGSIKAAYETTWGTGFRSITEGIGVSIDAPALVDSLAPFAVTISFNQNVTGFTQEHINVANATAVDGSFSPDNGSMYTVEITPEPGLCEGTITIDIPENVAEYAPNFPNLAASVTVTVNAIPSAPAVSSPIQYCVDQTADALTASGTNLLWYTSETEGTGEANAPIPDTENAGETSYYVSQTINGCESDRAEIVVTVNDLPVAPPAISSTNTPVCAGEDAVFTITGGTAGDMVTYHDGASTATATLGTDGTATVTVNGVSSDVTLTLTEVSNGNCSLSLTETAATVTVNALPVAPTISSTNSPVCVGEDAVFTITGTAGDEVTYHDGASTGMTTIEANGTATVTVTGVSSDATLILTEVSNGSCSLSLTEGATITVNAPVAPTISTNSPVCPGEDAVFTITGTAGDIVTYSGALSGEAIIETDGTATITVTEASSDVTLTLSNGSCSVPLTETATVTVQQSLLTAIAQNITMQLDASGQASITPEQVDNGSHGSCANDAISLSLDRTDFSCDDILDSPVTVTLTATDGITSATATAVIEVVDEIAPTAIARDYTVRLDASGNARVEANDINNGSFDNCNIADMSLSQEAFNDTGAFPVTLTVTDVGGNSHEATATVTVEPYVAQIGDAFTVSDIAYEITAVDPYEVEIIDYIGSAAEVEIPETVDDKNVTYTVTAIGAHAFNDNPDLTTVKMLSSNPPPLHEDAFADRDQIDLVVPEGAEEDYLNARWTGFRSITEEDQLITSIIGNELTDLKVYPNPARDRVHIDIDPGSGYVLEQVNIYTMTGAYLYSENGREIDTSRLSEGTYLFEIVTKTGNRSMKKVIIR